jgi:hypothetical protein
MIIGSVPVSLPNPQHHRLLADALIEFSHGETEGVDGVGEVVAGPAGGFGDVGEADPSNPSDLLTGAGPGVKVVAVRPGSR